MSVEWVSKTSSDATAAERRRAGRLAGANPNLIPLLRSSATLIEGEHDPDLVRFGSDQSAPARGIMIGLLLSGVIWAALLTAIRAML